MHIRLSIEDQAYVRLLQEHLAKSSPLLPEIAHTDIIRTALRVALRQAGISELQVPMEVDKLRQAQSRAEAA